MTPAERICAYFAACTQGSSEDIAGHFTADAVVYDTNVGPVRGAPAIGAFWVGVRERWRGAAWHVDTVVAEGEAAAIEWTMTGTGPEDRSFAVHGSEHYTFEEGRIAQIRQYWTYDRDRLDTGLVGFAYPDAG